MENRNFEESLSYLKYEPQWGAEPMPPVPEMPLFELIRQTAYRYPLKTALVSCGKKITYGEMNEFSDRLAAALADLGVQKGDRVAVMLPNCAQHVIAFHGIIKAGAASVPCNVMLKGEELAYILEDAGAAVVICLDVFYPLLAGVRKKTKIRQVISVHLADFSAPDGWVPPPFRKEKEEFPDVLDFRALLEKYPPAPPSLALDAREDLALILYTAGTTGQPKGVMETHYNMVYNCLSHAHLMGVDYNDVNLQIMPMFHTSGYFLGLHPFLYKGGTVVLMPLFDPGELLKIIAEEKVNVIFGPPTLFVALVNHPDLPGYNLKHLKLATGCGAPVPVPLQKRWRELTGIDLTNGWGMTETNSGGIISLPFKKNLDSIGVPVAGEVKIVDQAGNILPRGQIGEIMFRGPQVAKGYWNKPEETKAAFTPDGWLHTGDAGYISEDGFVYFVERIKDLIIASGYNIAPFEVESVIMKHPAVREAAVVGVPDEYRGETVKAFVVLKDEFRGKTTAGEIIEFCKENMATYKRPRIVEFLDELPKNAVGKVLRQKLREMGKRPEKTFPGSPPGEIEIH
ncbi:MAG: class I adenylate-forming enzyme family protein [Desulfotomaculales bacterium]